MSQGPAGLSSAVRLHPPRDRLIENTPLGVEQNRNAVHDGILVGLDGIAAARRATAQGFG